MEQYRIDLFAVFILLGFVQAVFLSYFFLKKPNRQKNTNTYLGLLLLVLAAVMVEIFLMYTGYIRHALHLVDFSESLPFLIGPLYLFLMYALSGKQLKKKRQYWHLLPFVLYSMYMLFFFTEPVAFKYNAWLGAYHPSLPEVPMSAVHNDDPLGIRFYVSELLTVHLAIYCLLCFRLVRQTLSLNNESFWSTRQVPLQLMRFYLLLPVSAIVVVLIVKATNQQDTGDHLLGSMIALQIYMISFSVLNSAGYYNLKPLLPPAEPPGERKADQEILAKARQVMEVQRPYVQANFSLPMLASLTGTGVHLLSAAINAGTGKNFAEFTAEYRIKMACELLQERSYLKIEEIAEQVVYNAKSSFNTAFKKVTGSTPAVWRDAQSALRSDL